MKSEFYYFQTRDDKWINQNTVVALTGLMCSGKTKLALDFVKDKKHFYFSFANLNESMARLFLSQRLFDNHQIHSWKEIFSEINEIARFQPIFIFDDIESLLSDNEFCNALNDFMNSTNRNRIFMVLIFNQGANISKLNLAFRCIESKPISIAKIKKATPNWSNQEILELHTLTGGFVPLIKLFDDSVPFKDNLLKLFDKNSLFVTFAEKMLRSSFRTPESYMMILYAIACGNHRVSEIGKFTGFAYNKCDKYLGSLIDCGYVITSKVDNKTFYSISNSYLEVWFKYIYPNRNLIEVGTFDTFFFSDIYPQFIKTDVEAHYREACFKVIRDRLICCVTNSTIEQVRDNPYTLKIKDFEYTFDCYVPEKSKAVFVKILTDTTEIAGKDMVAEFEKAAAKLNHLYNSELFICSKRRFSDFAVHEALGGFLKLITVERLKF